MRSPDNPKGRGGLARRSAVTSVAAAAGIASGLLLDVSIAATFGAGSATDAFFVGARIPLGILAIVMVAANQALVPTFSRWRTEKDDADDRRLVSLVVTGALLLAAGGAAVGAAGAPLLVRLTAPGLPASSMPVAASVARVMFLLVPCVALAEVCRAILNSRRAFAAPAAMHVVLNGSAAALVVVAGGADVRLVAWAYVLGGSAQLLFLTLMCRRHGFRYVPSCRFRDPELRATAAVTVRPLIAAGLNPVARVAEQTIVSFLAPGSITILNYGYRLISAIGGSVFFRSVIVVLVPRLTEATSRGDDREVARITGLGIRLMLVLSVPLTAFLAVLASPAVRAVFHRGSFSSHDTALLGMVLAVYAGSLAGSAVQRALLVPFFARLDTRTPLRNTMYGVTANVVLLLAAFPLRHDTDRAVLAVALAYSVAQYVHVAHALVRLRNLLGDHPIGALGPVLARLVRVCLLAAAVMLAGAWLLDLYEPASSVQLMARASAVGLAGLLLMGVGLRRGAGGLSHLWRMEPATVSAPCPAARS